MTYIITIKSVYKIFCIASNKKKAGGVFCIGGIEKGTMHIHFLFL